MSSAVAPMLALLAFPAFAVEPLYFGIRAVDGESGRGVPLVEFRTVNDVALVTDNAGRVAFQEPGMNGREVFFHVRSPGYDVEKDGFGFRGVRLVPEAGKTAEVKVRRTILAERMGRLTGGGLWRDSELLGHPAPVPSLGPAGILGQDSVQAVPYRGRLFFLWGDTNLARYPLGNFHTTAATLGADVRPERGVVFDVFVEKGAPRKMLPLDGPGAVWMFGLHTVRDGEAEVLLSGFSRHASLAKRTGQGMARFNDARGVFEVAGEVDNADSWRTPRGAAVQHEGWTYFASPFAHTRVRATVADATVPGRYEALRYDAEEKVWRWQRGEPPTLERDEAALLKSGAMPREHARFQVVDAEGKSVRIHGASIRWNAWRKRWLLLGVEIAEAKDAPSFLGEVWVTESVSLEGPWTVGVRVASHPRYSFYNPVHHDFWDEAGGRVIYFEGTYTKEFSGNPLATPRYDYNQLLYRLDLGRVFGK